MRVVSHHRRESRRARIERRPTGASDPRTRKRSADRLARASEGRRVGRSGRTRASRGDTRTLSLQAAQLDPWRARGMGGPASRGTRLVAPRPPAFSLRAPPVVKREVSLHPRPSTRAAKVRVSALLHGTGGRFHTSAYSRASAPTARWEAASARGDMQRSRAGMTSLTTSYPSRTPRRAGVGSFESSPMAHSIAGACSPSFRSRRRPPPASARSSAQPMPARLLSCLLRHP